jgi:hypothetical protein
MKPIRFELTDDLIDICYDNVFKAVFTRDTPESRGALSALLSAIIGRQLTVIALAINEPPISDIHDRQIRFDISCKAEDGELINVEMSLNPDTFELKRLEYQVKKQAEIARNALREGASIDFIQKITGLDSATISQLSLNG